MNEVSKTFRRAVELTRRGRLAVRRAERRALSKRSDVNAVSTIANLATSPRASTSG
jgi:hypothetical protein